MTKEVEFYFNCCRNFGKLPVSRSIFLICFQAVERAQTKAQTALLSVDTVNQTTNHGNVS